MNNHRIKYRPEIDGLRAIAVLVVIFYHFEISFFNKEIFSGGYLGVDIFFVISGYLITSILVNEYLSTGTISIVNFYERRIRRIIPLLFFVILACFPFAWFYLMPSSLIDFAKSALISLIFSSNFYFHFSENAYFNFNDSNPLLHTWSLSVEEQFYIFFPFFLLLILKLLQKKILKIFTIIILINLIIINLAGNLSFNYPFIEKDFSFESPNFFGSFYIFSSRLWELLTGSCIFFVEKEKKIKINKFTKLLPKVGIFIIFFSVILFNDRTFHPSIKTFLPVSGIFLIIFFSKQNELITKILSSRILVNLGLISYSLYLWHYPVLIFSKNLFVNINIIIILLIILTISMLSYKFIEKPFRNRKATSYKKTLIFISVISIIICSISFNFLLNKGHEKRFNYNLENFELDNKIYSDEWSLKQKNYFSGVDRNFNMNDNKKNILIIGDSHGQDFFNLLDSNANFYEKFEILYSSTRGGQDLLHFFKNSNYCKKFSKNVFPLIAKYSDKNNEKICDAETLIISNRYNPWDINKLYEIIEISKKIKKDLILVLIKPHFSTYGKLTIIDKFILNKNRFPNNYEIENLEKRYFHSQINNKFINNMNLKIKDISKNKNIKIFNLNKLICNNENKRCTILTDRNNKIIYDSSHFSLDGAKFLGKKVFETKLFDN